MGASVSKQFVRDPDPERAEDEQQQRASVSNFASRANSAKELALYLSSQAEAPAVLGFVSPRCGLCARVKRRLETVGPASGVPALVLLDATVPALWGPELVHYSVVQVPTFVVLGAADRRTGQRRVIGKTTRVDSAHHVLEGLARLLDRTGLDWTELN